jgi:hypothetical protein
MNVEFILRQATEVWSTHRDYSRVGVMCAAFKNCGSHRDHPRPGVNAVTCPS